MENDAVHKEREQINMDIEEIITNEASQSLQLLNKITKAKRKLRKRNIKKSGFNKHGKYHYFELEDIIPPIEEVFEEVGLGSFYEFEDTYALLWIYDSDTGHRRKWYTPIKTPSMPENKVDTGVHMKAIQSTQTYARRALWLQCLDILEPNVIEMNNDPKQSTKKQVPKKSVKKEVQKTPKKPVPADQIIQPIRPPREEEITPDMVEDVLNRTEEVLIDAGKQFTVENATWNIKKLSHGNKQLASACLEALKFRNAEGEG